MLHLHIKTASNCFCRIAIECPVRHARVLRRPILCRLFGAARREQEFSPEWRLLRAAYQITGTPE